MEMMTPELTLHLSMLEHVIWEGEDEDVPVGIDDKATPEEKAEYARWREEEKRKEELWEKALAAKESGDPDWQRLLPDKWDLD